MTYSMVTHNRLYLALLVSIVVFQLASFVYLRQNSQNFIVSRQLTFVEANAATLIANRNNLRTASGELGRHLLLSGWGKPETEATWTLGRVSTLALPIRSSDPNVYRIVIRFRPNLNDQVKQLNVRVFDGSGAALGDVVATIDRGTWILNVVSRPQQMEAQRFRIITIAVDKPRSPFELSVSRDARRIGVYLESVHVTP